MTIAALVRGRPATYNALVVDTGAMRSDGVVERHDKLHRLFGETFATCIGDASILKVLLAHVAREKKRPNLRDREVVGGLFSELEEARRTGLLLGVATLFPAAPPCTTLVICNRADAFFWKAEREDVSGLHNVPSTPTFLDPESMIVFRGVTVATVTGFSTVEQTTVEEVVVDQMLNVNAQLEAGGADKLGYEMGRRVSGIILPHKTTDPAVRIDPGVPQVLTRPVADRG